MTPSAVPGAPRQRPPASTDVARAAGVSQKTVSRVFNDEPFVSAAVRDRVLAAARELGYRPNSAARSLNSGRTRRLGVVSLGSTLYGPGSALSGIQTRARQLDYAVSVLNTPEHGPGDVLEAVETLLDQGADGIVLSEPVEVGPIELSVEVPVLTLGAFPGLRAPTIITSSGDGVSASAEATRHLLDLGHRTVHHVSGPLDWYSARDRRLGWQQALESAGVEIPHDVQGDWSAASGYAAATKLLEREPVTAIFAANDDMAVGAIRAVVDKGGEVPGSVSVVGFDDIAVAGFLNPPLTTVAAEHGRFAERGLDVLIDAIEGRVAKCDHHVSEKLVLLIRGSTHAPATRRDSHGDPAATREVSNRPPTR